MDYHKKYLKYKNKYIELKNQRNNNIQYGGDKAYIKNINNMNLFTDDRMAEHMLYMKDNDLEFL